MKKALSAGVSIAALTSVAFAANSLDSNPNYVKLKNFKPNPAVTNEQCLMCHKAQDPGIVADWQHSKHAKAGVGCVQCHVVPKDYPTAFKAHPMQGKNWTVQIAVSSVTCAKCHAKEVTEYLNSGHARGAAQWLASNMGKHGFLMSKLAYNYENMKGKHPSLNGYSAKKMAAGIRKDNSVFASNQNNPRQADLGVANICVQCHGTTVKLDSQGRPDAATWPSDGIATLYPDGGVGNCLACHSRHKFSAAEARQPAACSNCHLGPDHPDKEIFESSVHGHIFDTNEKDYNFETGKQIPGKTLRAATCFTCHMSGINGLKATHNVSLRLKWNLWAPKSFLRTKGAETAGWAFWSHGGKIIPGKTILRGNPKAGNPQGPEAARSQMKQVCAACHEATFVNNYFQRVDAQVKNYNNYFNAANKMLKELKAKGLIKSDVWSDPFFKLYYYLWHHEGRRMRQGAAMGSPDYAHWHGVFQVMQDIREMQDIYNYRMKMLKKYGNAKKVLENEPPMPVVTHE
ncbi:multiheme c-type cytochrome [Lebetimonas sp. JH292]|uniref:multiheme c-type cytochrome n=1 Tax=Lebetimonas sp. JH292 TaxID=990068 RepID=UPI000465DEA3|nr:multiheme c-type cytochrome [Lebetimonas sp. JH292]